MQRLQPFDHPMHMPFQVYHTTHTLRNVSQYTNEQVQDKDEVQVKVKGKDKVKVKGKGKVTGLMN